MTLAETSRPGDAVAAGAPFPPTATEAAVEIAAGRMSPVELVETCLARVEAVDDRIHTFITLDAENALKAAREAEADIAAGRYRGRLHGIPFAVKDNYDAAGLPTTGGSRLMAGNVPAVDATLVARMKAAGAILLGKLSSWEYGTGNGGEYFDLPIPTTRNPWDPERFAGGSSTGAGAAVAAGTTVIALGSDTTGSVRLPASACGVVGVRPTQGRLSKAGMIANCYSLDVPGPLTWTVSDAAMVLDAISGHDPRDVSSAAADAVRHGAGLFGGIAGWRIGVVRDLGAGTPPPDPAMDAAFEDGLAVLADLGADLRETSLPVSAAECFALTSIIGPAESAAIHERDLAERSGEMGYALRDKLLKGALIRAADYLAAQRQRRIVAASIDAMVGSFDAVVTFGACHVSPRLGAEPEMTAFTSDTALTPFSLSGHPTLVQCTGFTDEGLPLHWQLVGPRFREGAILQLAAAYEAATTWRQRRPIL